MGLGQKETELNELNAHMTNVSKVLATTKLFTETPWLSLDTSENQWPNPQRTEHAAPFFPFPDVTRPRGRRPPAHNQLYLTLKFLGVLWIAC